MSQRENILSASVPITLDGRELVLRYRAYAFIRYAEECGGDLLVDLRQLFGMFTEFGEQFKAGAFDRPAPALWAKLTNIIWAGLVDVQPELTRDQVARMFGMIDWQILMPAVTAAFQKTMPEAQPAENPTAALAPAPLNGAPLPGGSEFGAVSANPAELPLPNSAD